MGKLKDKADKDWVRGLQEDAGYRLKRRMERSGHHYDYKSAKEAGLGPGGADSHWPSRVPSGPKEGLLLKSPKHPTFGHAVWQDRKIGYHVRKKGGRLYSIKE